MAEYRAVCWQCLAGIVLPFEPRRGKLCDRCYLRPAPRPRPRRLSESDADCCEPARVVVEKARVQVRF